VGPRESCTGAHGSLGAILLPARCKLFGLPDRFAQIEQLDHFSCESLADFNRLKSFQKLTPIIRHGNVPEVKAKSLSEIAIDTSIQLRL
jgi:hypothetical protein